MDVENEDIANITIDTIRRDILPLNSNRFIYGFRKKVDENDSLSGVEAQFFISTSSTPHFFH